MGRKTAPPDWEVLIQSLQELKARDHDIEIEQAEVRLEIGDKLLTVQSQYGRSKVREAIALVGAKSGTWSQYMRTAAAIPVGDPIRDLSLKYAHLRDLIGVRDRALRRNLADQAAKESWGTARLRTEIRKRKAGAGSERVPARKKFLGCCAGPQCPNPKKELTSADPIFGMFHNLPICSCWCAQDYIISWMRKNMPRAA